MKLLLDENISYRVARIIRSQFPESIHVSEIPTIRWDSLIFSYAKQNEFTIVKFDEDFYDLQLLKGFPPKIIWLRFGNANNLKVANKIIEHHQNIYELIRDPDKGLIEIY